MKNSLLNILNFKNDVTHLIFLDSCKISTAVLFNTHVFCLADLIKDLVIKCVSLK